MDLETRAISRRLQQMQLALDLSAAALCRQTGLAQNRYSMYVTGQRRLSLGAAILICDHYGVTLDWLYRGNVSGLPVHLARILQTPPGAA